MRSVALANQKGGVGKTTTAVHLAHGLAIAGRKVALLDLDPQGNATVALQEMALDLESDGALALLRPVTDNLWLLPSPGAERAVDRFSGVDVTKLLQLARSLEEQGIEWLLVDCPPRMDQWGWAGLQLCGEVLVPVQPEFFAMHGLSQMLGTLETAQAQFPDKGQLLGVLVTLWDQREPVAKDVVADLRRNLGARMLETVILRDSSLVEAASYGKTVFEYRPYSKAALCYGELVREVVHGGSSLG